MTPSPRILVLDRPITARELEGLLGNPFEDLVKFVVDLDRRLVAFGGELHADAEAVLLDQESRQEALWGGNYHPLRDDAASIEYTSLINIHPAQGNRSIEVQDLTLRGRIRALVLERRTRWSGAAVNHSSLTTERWARFTFPQQILQIAAEMHRARHSFPSHDEAYLRSCYERALQLLDLTVGARMRSPMRRELLRWRYFVAGLYASGEMDAAAHDLALRTLLRLNAETNLHAEPLGV